MFERFNDQARTSVVVAQEQARSLHHDYIGTEHLLLGLLDNPDSVASKVLSAFGVRPVAVETDVVAIVGRGDGAPSGHIPFTPRAKKVLELSLREALQLGHAYIGTEHILLGITREGEGVAAQVLTKHIGLTHDTVRERVSVHLEATGPKRSRSTRRTPAATGILETADELAGDAPVGSQHLLEALLKAEGSMAANALAILGIDADAVATTLNEVRLEETTDVTPEQAAAHQMRLRVDGDEIHVVIGDSDSVERAKHVIELAGGAMTGDGPIGGAFIPIWTAVSNSLIRLEAALSAPRTENADRRKRRRRD